MGLVLLGLLILVMVVTADGEGPLTLSDKQAANDDEKQPDQPQIPMAKFKDISKIMTADSPRPIMRNTNLMIRGMNPLDLLWKPNDSGLYNHFFELKYLAPFLRQLQRRLWVESVHSPHYDREEMLCNLFIFPNEITCAIRHLLRACGLKFYAQVLSIQRNESNICFSEGVFNRTSLHTQRYFIYLHPELRLQLQPRYHRLYQELHKQLLLRPIPVYKPQNITNDTLEYVRAKWPDRYSQHNLGEHTIPSLTNDDFVAIHWRRGDQLITRCDGNHDFVGYTDDSVNCANTTVFLNFLHLERARFPPKTRFVIFTNEESTKDLLLLRKHGYVLIQDLIHSFVYRNYTIIFSADTLNISSLPVVTSPHRRTAVSRGKLSRVRRPSIWRLSEMDELLVESLFMVHSRVLINFGISTMHDAIESERWFLANETGHPISFCYMAQSVYSWCHAYALQRQLEGSVNGTGSGKPMQVPWINVPAVY